MKPVIRVENAMYAGSWVLSAREPLTIVADVAAKEKWKIHMRYRLSSDLSNSEQANMPPSVPMNPPFPE